ncbi:MAG TPA: sigma-70 family RNA polymerase sigma factor [Gemmataceae bacterium]|jgi:RNA polymerase sigma-70 factor (ECF subfamily)
MTTDPDDWAGWFDAHAAALVLFARQWAPATADAEDVVHDAFVRFWPARHRADDPTAYLYACVRRAALDWLRGRRRRAAREERAARAESADDSLFLSAPERAERRAAVEAALARLPDDQRAVLVLKIWGGLTFAQVAAALDIPANTAASRYRYALARLRELLAEANVP